MKKILGMLLVLIFSLVVLSACSSFITKESMKRVEWIEKSDFRLIKDIVRGQRSLKSGDIVRLQVVEGDESIKVYASLKNSKLLDARWIIIVYMFKSDFPKSKFDEKIFNSELNKIVKKIDK